jgi:glutamate racemase
LNTDRPIGIFDSGVGGLTVVSHIQKKLPFENLIYFGDTARVPYGTKAPETIKKFSLEIANFLVEKDVKCIIIACNSASAHAIHHIRKHYPNIPIYGMIESGADFTLSQTKSNFVGVIGTTATIRSRAYQIHLERINKNINVSSFACPLFVPFVEEGLYESDLIDPVIDHYFADLNTEDIDSLILGCTHYPFLYNKINEYFNGEVTLIDSGEAAANYVKEHLKEFEESKKDREPFYHCYLTSATNKFFSIAENCMIKPFDEIHYVDID